MAYYDDPNEQNPQAAGKSGVIAGSGGAGSKTPTTTGSGFTNLQQYLTANQGAGGGVADNIISQGQNAVTNAQKTADAGATAWADQGVQRAQQAGQDAVSDFRGGNSNAAYNGPTDAKQVEGYNDLDKAYQNVKNTATNFAGDYNTQKAGLQNQYGYGSGFGALDTFLGRQDGRSKIQGWADGVSASPQAAVDRVTTATKLAQGELTSAKNDAAVGSMIAPMGVPSMSPGASISIPDNIADQWDIPGLPKRGNVYDPNPNPKTSKTSGGVTGRNFQR